MDLWTRYLLKTVKHNEGREELSPEKRMSTESALVPATTNYWNKFKIQTNWRLKKRISTLGEKEHVARMLSVIVETLNMSTLQYKIK